MTALCRLSDSTFALSMVLRSPSLPTPAATPAEAVLAVAGTRPDSETATRSCPEPGGCRTRPDSVVAPLAPDRRPGQGDVSPGLRCGPDRRPSRGVGNPGLWPAGRRPGCAPCRPLRVGHSLPSGYLPGARSPSRPLACRPLVRDSAGF